MEENVLYQETKYCKACILFTLYFIKELIITSKNNIYMYVFVCFTSVRYKNPLSFFFPDKRWQVCSFRETLHSRKYMEVCIEQPCVLNNLPLDFPYHLVGFEVVAVKMCIK